MKNLWRCFPLIMSLAASAADKPKSDYTPQLLRPFLKAKTWTVFSLDPMKIDDGKPRNPEDPFAAPPPGSIEIEPAPAEPKPKLPPNQIFHDYAILGQHTLPVTPEMKVIIQDLDRAERLSRGEGAVGCYFPRHGIRVVEGGRVYDLQLCYQCAIANLFVGTEYLGGFQFFDRGPQAPNPNALNVILKKAGVKLSPY